MYFKTCIVLFLMAIISFPMYAQTDMPHYYIHIKGSDSLSYKISMGTIVYDNDFTPKRVIDAGIQSWDQLLDKLYEVSGENDNYEYINVIIHGIWADIPVEWTKMIRNITRDALYHDQKKVANLSIIWDSSFNYVKGAKIATGKGIFLSDFLKALLAKNNANSKINFLCHSMGNLIFEKMMIHSGIMSNADTTTIHQYISVAGDLNSQAFLEGGSFENIGKTIDRTIIYRHNNDRSLKVSKAINKADRIGLTPLKNLIFADPSVVVIDVSTIRDYDDLASSVSNHRYFYMSQSFREDLKRTLYDQSIMQNKEVLYHDNVLKLLSVKN